MGLLVGQLPKKSGQRYASHALQDITEAIFQRPMPPLVLEPNFITGELKIVFQVSLQDLLLGSPFHFPEAVQAFLNPAPITQGSINSQQNKIQVPLALSSINTPNILNYTTPLQGSLGRSFSPRELHKEILNSTPPPNSLINARNKKRQNLGFTQHPHFL